MELLAQHLGLNTEDAHTIGILHAIGRVLINRVIEQNGFAIYWTPPQPISDWERGAVGFDYAEAGAMLLKHWQFPDTTSDVIGCQLEPTESIEQISMPGALQFTRRLIALTRSDFENQDWDFPGTDPFVQAAELTPELLGEHISACREDFEVIRKSMDLA